MIALLCLLIWFLLANPKVDSDTNGTIIVHNQTNNTNNTSNLTAEQEAARKAELKAEEEKLKLERLRTVCKNYFDKNIEGDYDYHTFKDKDVAKTWVEEITKTRLDKTKTFDERVWYQLRHQFNWFKIQAANSTPIAIAVGDINSSDFDESVGLLCIINGPVTITGDSKDNLIFQTTMRREWM
jgi:hypothetical protein